MSKEKMVNIEVGEDTLLIEELLNDRVAQEHIGYETTRKLNTARRRFHKMNLEKAQRVEKNFMDALKLANS